MISQASNPASCEISGPAFSFFACLPCCTALARSLTIAAGERLHCSSDAPSEAVLNGAGDPGAELAGDGDARGVCEDDAALEGVPVGLVEVLLVVEFVGKEGEARCINLRAFTRPLRLVTVADLPGGAETMTALLRSIDRRCW